MSIVHPVVCSPIINPVVDVLGPVAWGAGQTLAQRLAAEYGVIAAGRYTDWTTGKLRASVGDDLDFAYAAGTVAADGSTQAVGLAPLHAGKGVLHDASRTNRISGDSTQARTASLTSGTVYTLWVSSGSATCSYGTATAAAPLTFTATATATVTFTPTGVTRWTLTATSFPVGYYIAPGTTTVNTYGTTTTGVSLPAPVGGDVWNTLTGGELTLIVDDVRLAGSGDLVASTYSTVSEKADAYNNIIGFSNINIVRSRDGNTTSQIVNSWTRNSNIISVVNVRNNSGAWQFRVNHINLTLGQATLSQTDEQDWVTYDGSFNPDAALQKLMFFYLNAYPGYLRRYVICNRNLTGAETMKLLTKDFTVPAYA